MILPIPGSNLYNPSRPHTLKSGPASQSLIECLKKKIIKELQYPSMLQYDLKRAAKKCFDQTFSESMTTQGVSTYVHFALPQRMRS